MSHIDELEDDVFDNPGDLEAEKLLDSALLLEDEQIDL